MTGAVNVVLVAGGRGTRLGGPVPKQFRELGGEPMLVVTARRFVGTPELTRVVVVAAPEEHPRCEALLSPLGLPFRLAAAGAERQHSVASGLAAIDRDCAIVLVHDAARPLVTQAVIVASIEAAARGGAAVVATPVPDTVKRGADGQVVETVPRGDLWLAQTPQTFRADVLRRAHAAAEADGVVATDDTALVERLGLRVAIVPGDPTNRKITTPDDLVWAEARLSGESRAGASRLVRT